MNTSGSLGLGPDPSAAPASEPPAGGPAREDPAEPPVKILLVDDDPKNLTVLETLLDDPRYRLVKAESADTALLALVHEEFALIVLDIQMPGMNGLELAQMIKQRKRTAAVPIIFLTAYFSDDQHVLEGYVTGAVDYLHKPVNATILRSKVAAFAELHRKTQELARANARLQAEVVERRRIQEEVSQLNDELESRVTLRTAELTRSNQALRESDERLRMAQQAGKVGIWSFDLKTGAGAWTDSAWEIFDPSGRGNDITLARWLSYVHPEDRGRIFHSATQVRSETAYREEYRVLLADGSIKWVEAVGEVESDADQTPVRLRGSFTDVTARKEMELELKEQGRRKDEFLAMLGHELRNPLAPVRNVVAIVQGLADANPVLTECHAILDRQVSQLTRIVDDLLDVSRVSRGKIQLHKVPIDLAIVVQHAVETCRHLIEARRHALDIRLPPDPLIVEGDLARLSQVVANLLNNSAKYTDEGGRITLALAPAPEAPEQVVIRVEDNGRGFDSVVADNLFSLFYQVDRTLDRADGGLGIGLALVRNLVEMHGGTVEAHSPGRGQGSEFLVRLPRGEPPVAPAPEVPLPPPVHEPGPRSVLVVDDNLDAARTLGMLLKLLGYEVTLAHDGEEAVRVALASLPDVIFLDIGLPRLNGYQVCERLRQEPGKQPLIVALTGYGQEEDRIRTTLAGFDQHLVKPVDVDAIKRILARERASR